MKKNKIKMVKRIGIETNSSSSHTLAISLEKDYLKPGDEGWDLKINSGELFIPDHKNGFGRGFFKSNSCEVKLQYLVSLIFYESGEKDIDVNQQKDIKKLEETLKKIFNVERVRFECLEDYKQNYKDYIESGYKPDLTPNWWPPTVDHQSRDNIFEILENEETIRSFLLSPKSWLFGGSDDYDIPDKLYTQLFKRREKNATYSIEFPGIGRVDFRYYYPSNNCLRFYFDGRSNFYHQSMLDLLYYDPNEKTMKATNKSLFEEGDEKLYFNIVTFIDGILYAIYTRIDKSLRYPSLINLEKDCKEGVDYMKFKVNIISDIIGDVSL